MKKVSNVQKYLLTTVQRKNVCEVKLIFLVTSHLFRLDNFRSQVLFLKIRMKNRQRTQITILKTNLLFCASFIN